MKGQGRERKLSLVLWKGGRGEGTVRMERKLSLVLWKGGRGEGGSIVPGQ